MTSAEHLTEAVRILEFARDDQIGSQLRIDHIVEAYELINKAWDAAIEEKAERPEAE
jgi:hypothetical protein